MLITKLSQEDIQRINKEVSYEDSNQGVFFEPYGFPGNMKGHTLIYMRWPKSGMQGGTYHEDSETEPFSNDEPNFIILDKVIEIVCPNITYIQFKKLFSHIKSTMDHEWGYYGNYTDWEIKYISLEEFYSLLESM